MIDAARATDAWGPGTPPPPGPHPPPPPRGEANTAATGGLYDLPSSR